MMTQENLLARYTVLHEQGRGAIGAVYAARDRTTGAVVALKRLDPALSKADASLAGRFLKNARSARRLRHANIARIHDAGEAGGTVYVAMEMLEGESLRKLLDDGPLPIARAMRIAHDIASGLAYAHLQGVVHGGLKPSDIIVLRSGAAKITDFGTGQAAPGYRAPEQRQAGPVDHRSDVFSFGALLYEMLTGEKAAAPPKPPSALNPLVPRALDEIVLGMLATQPAARMPGFPILLRELQRLEEGLGLASKTNAPPAKPEPERVAPVAAEREVLDTHKAMAVMERESRQRPRSRSRPAIFATLALMLGVLGIGLADFMFSSGRGEPDIAARPVQEAPAIAPVASRLPATPPVAEVTKAPPPAPAPAPAPMPVAKVPEPQPEGTAQLILAVSPRGEIYIDGKHHGTTPPITRLELEPGLHRIEVRRGSRKPFLTYMTVQAGDVRRIRHDFDTKGMRPPT